MTFKEEFVDGLKGVLPRLGMGALKLSIWLAVLLYLITVAKPLSTFLLSLYLKNPGDEAVAMLSIGLIIFGAELARRGLFPRRVSYGSRPTVAMASSTGLVSDLQRSKERIVSSHVARHEAGHVVAALHFGEPVLLATIVGEDDSNGRVEMPSWNTGDHGVERSKERLWGNLVIKLAGTVQDQLDGVQDFGSTADLRAAEKLFTPLMSVRYGAGADGYPLPASELHRRGMLHARAVLEANSEAVNLAEKLLIEHEELTPASEGNPLARIQELIIPVPDPAG